MIELGRGYLDAGRVEGFELGKAFQAEGTCEEYQPLFFAIRGDLDIEVWLYFKFPESVIEADFSTGKVYETGIGMQYLVGVHDLEFRAVRTRLRCGVNKVFRLSDIAAMARPDFRDDHHPIEGRKTPSRDVECPFCHSLIVSSTLCLSMKNRKKRARQRRYDAVS